MPDNQPSDSLFDGLPKYPGRSDDYLSDLEDADAEFEDDDEVASQPGQDQSASPPNAGRSRFSRKVLILVLLAMIPCAIFPLYAFRVVQLGVELVLAAFLAVGLLVVLLLPFGIRILIFALLKEHHDNWERRRDDRSASYRDDSEWGTVRQIMERKKRRRQR
jgi:hypothetical protein